MDDIYIFGAVLCFIALDIISGYAAALKAGTVSSSVMREGLFKKAGSIMLIVGAVIIEHMGVYIGIAESITSAVVYGVGAMLVAMELTSFGENVCKINPDIPIAKVFALFGIDEHGEMCVPESGECPYLINASKEVEETKAADDVCISD